MNFLHEGVKMHASGRYPVKMLHEKVHQHGFSAPDSTPEIDPLGCLGCLAEKPLFLDRLQKSVVHALQLRQSGNLCRVCLQGAVSGQAGIMFGQRSHGFQ